MAVVWRRTWLGQESTSGRKQYRQLLNRIQVKNDKKWRKREEIVRFWGEGNSRIQCLELEWTRSSDSFGKESFCPLLSCLCIYSSFRALFSSFAFWRPPFTHLLLKLIFGITFLASGKCVQKVIIYVLFFALIVLYFPTTTTQVCADVNTDWRWETNGRNCNIKDRL